ncbi:DUF4174 domain-containing protein [Acuticoccus sp. MNP-M23]|uniref:DUF4174 domain-containing protein n=1 Tax=Acuticoccus sp. MNP-M23 TaxID=3072793 RepID=UPI00281674C7|nr:DUF4174 domain-containing protein [Acuticoccus sp. MNP-M23]WMS44170.1 DUF4174 domain-containing protein [Acuticoccus sp. MNP-M23]
MIRALVAVLFSVFGGAAMASDLDEVRWQYRPLLVFTPAADNTSLSRQTTILADNKAGLTPRKIAVYVVEMDRVFTIFGAPAPDADAKRLRRRFRVPDAAFRVVLIGLDGGAKLTRDEALPADELFNTIDAMPMRQRELRERASGN